MLVRIRGAWIDVRREYVLRVHALESENRR